MLYFEVANKQLGGVSLFVCLVFLKTRSPYVGQGSLELSIPSLPSAEVTGVHHHVRFFSFGVKIVGFVFWKSMKVAC